MNLSMKSPKKKKDGNIKNVKDTLFKPKVEKVEMCVQTDDEDIQPRKLQSRKTVRMMDSHSKLGGMVSAMTGPSGDRKEEPYNPDKYKEDWVDSLTFKKAMRSYAIKIGASYGSELDYDEDGDDERLMNNTIYDGATRKGDDSQHMSTDNDLSNFDYNEENAQDANQIGFMKKGAK